MNALTDCKALIKICQKINYGKDTGKDTVFLILLRLTDVLMSAREWWTQGLRRLSSYLFDLDMREEVEEYLEGTDF